MKFLENNELKDIVSGNSNLEKPVIVDIREPDEYAREHIQGSRNIPLSQWDNIDNTQFADKTVLVHCKTGMRTQQAKDKIMQLKCKQILCLPGGIEQWKKCGLDTHVNKKAPMELMRQVQIIVGSLILIGIILSLTISTYFIIFSIFFSCGLIFAGITGWCGMAKFLSFLRSKK